MNAARKLFDNSEITQILKSRLKKIKKLNLEKGLLYLQNSENELYTVLPREEMKTIMLKVEKKKNISTVIESVKSDLEQVLNVDEDIIEMSYNINVYNNIVYVKRKY